MDEKHCLMVVDTETANTLIDENGKLDMSNVLVYDCGWCVLDTDGEIYIERSFVNADIFLDEQTLMEEAYYASKIPQYWEEIKNGSRILANTYTIRKIMLEDMRAYGVTEVVAHNARFDYNALNMTQRWMTKSKWRYWFPYGTEILDTMKMARDVIYNMPAYREFCEANGFLTSTGKLPLTAEILYRFISNDLEFEESHTGLEDVQIEREILLYCLRSGQPMRMRLWGE